MAITSTRSSMLKPERRSRRNPIAVREVKFDARVAWPFDAVHIERRAEEPIRGGDALLRRHTQHQQEGVCEKDQLAARAQKACSLWDPARRVGPKACAVLRDREVEALIGIGN